MTSSETPAAGECLFCSIVARTAEASVAFEDETVVAFMDRFPVTPGHLLVVPRRHLVGLEELDAATGGHVWETGRRLAQALRRSRLGCEGINLMVCDGAAAFQTVFHFHLHVIPRYLDDGWAIKGLPSERERSLLDDDARALNRALA